MERTKGHDNTLTLQNVIFIVKVSAVLAISCYCGYPKIINVIQGVDLWFDWFRLVLRNVFFIFIILNALIGAIYFSFLKTTGEKKQDLYDEYIAVVRPSQETSFRPMEVGDYGCGYSSNSRCQETTVAPFQVVKTVEESKCYERVVMETSSKSYRRTTSLEEKKKKRSMVEYRRTESERVMKTASWRSQAMDELSSEEFQMKVETFIMGYKKKIYCQNGGVDQLQNCVPQWQGQPDPSGTDRRSRRLMGGPGPTGSGGPYLAISN
ncbi:unnamed protein product [Eruca vesicaria subsp. sativa]|uniref:Ion transport domain-containing protein n=1 Tax=Eruca vesicaria subsp. sativa TaxID=29727 RepID=A0ABC8KNR1_ERUVS|nr:unnamed protein product [Eruca vesicaria subsp. sativa]